jgi:cellulose synthase/poly-beta-1,6-N-acetylglucosamine synthase-like glycosyltransferase
MEALFWLATFTIVFVYLGYPLSLHLFRPNHAEYFRGDLPSVAVVIPAYNEVDCIEATIRNKFALNYPADRLCIWIVSDDSDDGTNERVDALSQGAPIPVTLLVQSPRQGKTSGVNMAVAQIDSDILVFSDANSIYHPDAVKRLVERLREPNVGYVTGKMVYANPDGSISGDGCSGYMRYENWLRSLEDRVGSVIGVDGGVDAMWRRDFTPLRADQLPDFVQPLKIMEKGLRVVYASHALLTEDVTTSSSSEYRMRVRVALRAMWALWDMRSLLNPCRFGRVSYQVWSHKLFRYLLFLPLIIAFISAAMLTLKGSGVIYLLALITQLVAYGLAIWVEFGHPPTPPKLAVLCHYFALVNLASAHAFLRLIRGQKQVLWQPRIG